MAEPFTIYKLMVLYMAQHSREELTNSSDFRVCAGQRVHGLPSSSAGAVRTGGNRLDTEDSFNSSHYELTDEGSKTLSYFENDLSQDIRNEIEEFLRDYGYEMPERILMPPIIIQRPGNPCGSVPADRKGCHDHGSDNGCAQ